MRGIITEVKNNRAIILKSDGTFEEITNKNYQTGQEIHWERYPYKKHMWVAACLLLVFGLTFGGVKSYYTPVEYIYIDINPSMRLNVNMYGSVISVTPLNDDAKNITAFNRIPEKCTEEIIDECIQKGYLNEENKDVAIYVYNGDRNTEQTLISVCENYTGCGYIISVEAAEKQETKYANAHGISVGEYRTQIKSEKDNGKKAEQPKQKEEQSTQKLNDVKPTKKPQEEKNNPSSANKSSENHKEEKSQDPNSQNSDSKPKEEQSTQKANDIKPTKKPQEEKNNPSSANKSSENHKEKKSQTPNPQNADSKQKEKNPPQKSKENSKQESPKNNQSESSHSNGNLQKENGNNGKSSEAGTSKK